MASPVPPCRRGDEHRCLGQDVQLGNHLAYFHVGGDVLQAGGVDGTQGCEDVDVQVPDCVKQDRVILRPVVEGGAQGRVQQGFAVVGGLPAAEGGPLADLYPGEHETVIESLVIGNQLFCIMTRLKSPWPSKISLTVSRRQPYFRHRSGPTAPRLCAEGGPAGSSRTRRLPSSCRWRGSWCRA